MAQIITATASPPPAAPARLHIEAFAPSMWADTFTSFSFDPQVQERYSKEIEELTEEVRKMFVGGNNTHYDMLIFIDNLERLGVAYHFKKEKEEQLRSIFKSQSQGNGDLFTAALQFRLLRQHHYYVSPGVFDKFKGKDGKFDEEISSDGNGLLSLYEATHVRIHGEHILEEALPFTTHHLSLLAPKLESPLGDQVKRALQFTIYKGCPKIETRYYISFYEKDTNHNEVLLKLAKLDFNYVQNLYKKELHDISKWWYNFDLQSKLPYARDRAVESYFWGNTMVYEPNQSFIRVWVVKCILITSILDDTYDNYATIEEADAFTEALQRWDNEIEHLPEYMKVVYNFIVTTYDELLSEASEYGRTFAAPYVKEAIKEIGRGYNQELKWFTGVQVPTFEAYNSNVIITSTVFTVCLPALFGLESATDQVFEKILTWPKLVLASARIGRYLDDVGSSEREGRNGQMDTAITMHMKHYGVNEQEALKRFGEMIEEAWADINADCLDQSSSGIPGDVVEVFLNFARTSEIFYKHSVDGYTKPEKFLATEIAGLLVNPLTV